MKIRLLEYFLAVVQEENRFRAAEVRHVIQPTLSHQMAQLEEELGTQLFIRVRHLILTDSGCAASFRFPFIMSSVFFYTKNENMGILFIFLNDVFKGGMLTVKDTRTNKYLPAYDPIQEGYFRAGTAYQELFLSSDCRLGRYVSEFFEVRDSVPSWRNLFFLSGYFEIRFHPGCRCRGCYDGYERYHWHAFGIPFFCAPL